MDFTILTLFPEFIDQGLHTSILGKASEKGLLSFNAVNIRDYSKDRLGRVDDYTYGGGAGMLMQAQPVFDAYMSSCVHEGKKRPRTIYVTPQGKPFSQADACELAREESLVFICGHYEGIDERVLEEIVTDRYSIGDYVLTGGELASLVMIDAISRLVPGVLGNDISADIESFHNDLLEYPQYTRPEVWKEKRVPEVLLTGNPKEVSSWRLEKSKDLTQKVRPDLYKRYSERESVKELLYKDKRNNIHIIEALNRGMGEIVCMQPLVVYIPGPHIALLHALDEIDYTEDELVNALPLKTQWLVTDKKLADILASSGKYELNSDIYNAVYTEKVHKKIKNKDIRKLDLSYLDYVAEHYEHGNSDYSRDRINRGLMYGIFENDNICGFIGIHNEGSIGMLYVDENHRGKGYGADLENYMFNKALAEGQTPFGQIILGNEASIKLQEKNGVYIGNKVLSWLRKL